MIWIILFLGLIVRLLNLNQSFWLDEAAQVIESVRPLSQQFDIQGDFWPPLYHVLLHVWMYFGTSEVWIRLLSVTFALATLVLVYKLAYELTSETIARLTMLLVATTPFHVWYSQEARPYALATLLGIATIYFLIKQSWLNYLIAAILFLYSSYLAVFLLVAQGAYVWVMKKKYWKVWLKNISISVLFFLPWFPSLYKQLVIGSGLTQALPGWSEAVSAPILKSLPLTFTKFMVGRVTFDNKIFYAVLVIGLFAVFIGLVFRAYRANKPVVSQIGFLGVLPVLLAFLTSFFLPILAPQRVLFALPLMYLLIAMGLSTYKKYFWIPICIILLVNFYSLYLYNSNPRFQREQWRQAVAYVEKTRSSQSLAVFVFPDAFAPWQWYSKNVVSDVGLAPQFVVSDAVLNIQFLKLSSADKLYYFHYLTDLTDPQKRVPPYLEGLGYYETNKKDFPGVGFITIYEKALANR